MVERNRRRSASKKPKRSPEELSERHMVALVDDTPAEFQLTIAINALRAAWARHQGGRPVGHERAAGLVAQRVLERFLAGLLPMQEGAIGLTRNEILQRIGK